MTDYTTEIEDLASDGYTTQFTSPRERFFRGHDPELLAVGTDDTHLADSNPLVDAGGVLFGCNDSELGSGRDE